MSMFGNDPKAKKEIVPEIGQQTQNNSTEVVFYVSIPSLYRSRNEDEVFILESI